MIKESNIKKESKMYLATDIYECCETSGKGGVDESNIEVCIIDSILTKHSI